MALTGLDIYKQLPRTNCGDCGVPTCLAFAMKLAQKQVSLEQCPHASAEAKAALEGAAAPPIKLITIGAGEKKIEVGNETVLFRHEETFHRPPAIAVTVKADSSADESGARLEKIKTLSFERVGQSIGVNLVAVVGGTDAAQFAAAAQLVADNCDLAILLMSEDPEAMKAAVAAVKDRKPLLYAATPDNAEAMAAVAKEAGCPLVIKADGVAALAALSQKVQAAGVNDLILDSGARDPARLVTDQTLIRRAALRKKFRPLGFPTLAFANSDDAMAEALLASLAVAKYAGIVVLDGAEPWELLPILTVRQNIYTDPQKPIQLQSGLYEIGSPGTDSPVLVTTNFSLTYFTVEGDVEASKVPAWVVVVDTEGTSVLTAWASDKFTAETIAAKVKQTEVESKVSHRKLVIPGYVAVLSGKLEDESGWKVIVGPRESSGLPTFLRSSWSPA